MQNQQNNKNSNNDCLDCKLTVSIGSFVLGSWVLYNSLSKNTFSIRSKPSFAVGLAFYYISISRILYLPPFKSLKPNNEN